jgi:hypothetical protein
VRTVVVFCQELLQQERQLLVILPGFVPQPLFERADEAFSAAVGLRPVARNGDMDECRTAYQALKGVGGEVGPAICNQKAQFGWQQSA